MDNPFERRASENILEPRALLPLVSPNPMEYFYSPEKRALFEKLTMWVGSPGCGKTTIARILEFDSLWEICRSQGKLNRELETFLASINAIDDGMPMLITHRIPMTTNFRSIWELPYEVNLREALLRAFVQSKAVLGWLRQLERAEIQFNDVEIIFNDNSESARTEMRTHNINEFRDYARAIELSVFKVVTSLIPPKEEELRNILNSRYDIFEEIRGIKVRKWLDQSWGERILKPMVVIDDAHELHQEQFVHLRDWLKSRVITVSRWIMCRLDVIPPEDYSDAITRGAMQDEDLTPGSTQGRDYYVKFMQPTGKNANKFRRVAADIANRYFATVPTFSGHSVKHLEQALDTHVPNLPPSAIDQLEKEITKLSKEGKFSTARVDSLLNRVPRNVSKGEQLGVMRILLNREINNTPQLELLSTEPVPDEEIEDKGTIQSSLLEGARIQLMHDFKRPYYFGINKLADASNANIEQFISLTGPLVDHLITKIIRHKPAEVLPIAQHQALQARAVELMNNWDFPYHENVRNLVAWISKRCLEKTLLSYAPLSDGANAFGVPQEDMDIALKKYERLAKTLHFAFAYKALVMVPYYKCKNKRWCLLELGGVPILASGLTLSKGGFIEGTVSELDSQIGG